MLEYIPFSIALAGSSLAGAWDLKTTEIPDIIPHIMIVLGLVFWGIQAFLLNDYWLIAQSALVGGGFLGFGFLMYRFGQWGGGDAKILGAVGFLVPVSILNFPTLAILPFSLGYLLNVFFLGAVYMIVYAVIFALRDRKIIHHFLTNVKSNAKTTSLIFIGVFALFMISTYFLNLQFNISINFLQMFNTALIVSLLSLGLILLWRFVMSVERVGFRRKIPTSKLKEGDVLLESKVWEGLTKRQVNKIKKSVKRYVIVKDGVRFGPVFPIALVFTFFVGDFLALFLGFV